MKQFISLMVVAVGVCSAFAATKPIPRIRRLISPGVGEAIAPTPAYQQEFTAPQDTADRAQLTVAGPWNAAGDKTKVRWRKLVTGKWATELGGKGALEAPVVFDEYNYLITATLRGLKASSAAALKISLIDPKTSKTLLTTTRDGRFHQSPMSQELWAIGFRGDAAKAVDGDSKTDWVCHWGGLHPRSWIILDIGRAEWVDGIRYTPPSDAKLAIKNYRILVGQDSYSWTEVARGQFAQTGAQTVELDYSKLTDMPPEQYARLQPSHYVKIEIDSSYGQATKAGAAEFSLVLKNEDNAPRKALSETEVFWYVPESLIAKIAQQRLLVKVEPAGQTPVLMDGIRMYSLPGDWGKRGKDTPKMVDTGAIGFRCRNWPYEAIMPVTEIRENSLAVRVGVRVGDLIVAVGGKPLAAATTDASVSWLLRGQEATIGNEMIRALSGPTSEAFKMTVLRDDGLKEITIPLGHLPRFVAKDFPYKCAIVKQIRKDIEKIAEEYLTKGGLSMSGGGSVPTSFAFFTLLGSGNPAYGPLLKRKVDDFLVRNRGQIAAKPWGVGHAGMALAEYYLATGDPSALQWIKRILTWAPQATSVSAHGVPIYGHGFGSLPYNRKSFMASNVPMLAFDALAARCCGVKGIEGNPWYPLNRNLWDLLNPYVRKAWSDPAYGGHGGIAYGASFTSRAIGSSRQAWYRTGGIAIAAMLNDDKAMRKGLVQYLSNYHWAMRDSHAFGVPGAVWGLFCLAGTDREGFDHVMRQWPWQLILAWEPGYGLRYSDYHMGCPYMPLHQTLNCGHGAVLAAINNGIHLVGGAKRNWLDVSSVKSVVPGPVEIFRNAGRAKIVGGVVTMRCTPTGEIRYTLDGGDPTAQSTLYTEPFELPLGGIVKARSFAADGTAGVITQQAYGMRKQEWVNFGKNIHSFLLGLDGDPETFYIRTTPFVELPPHDFAATLPAKRPAVGFWVLARKGAIGTKSRLKDYAFYVNRTREGWGEPVAQGTIEVGPKGQGPLGLLDVVKFDKIVDVETFRLLVNSTQRDANCFSFAEFDFMDPMPTISWNKSKGELEITAPGDLPIRYSLDCSVPTTKSPDWRTSPKKIKPGMKIYARCGNDGDWLGAPVIYQIAKFVPGRWTQSVHRANRRAADFTQNKLLSVTKLNVTNFLDAPITGHERSIAASIYVYETQATVVEAGTLELAIGSKRRVRAYVDGELLVEIPAVVRQRGKPLIPAELPLRTKTATVQLQSGLHKLRLEYWGPTKDTDCRFKTNFK